MKRVKLETGSVIDLFETGEAGSYPVQSIEGAGKHNPQRGWITRTVPEDTIIVSLVSVDALCAGFAVPMQEVKEAFDLMDRFDHIRIVGELTREINRLTKIKAPLKTVKKATSRVKQDPPKSAKKTAPKRRK